MDSRTRNDPALALTRRQLTRLIGWASAGYPEESCGVFLGRETPGAIVVRSVHQVPNVTPVRRRDRYVLDPGALVALDAAARAAGLDVVGFWHSHPDHPARPSRTDLERAWEGYAYVILAVDRGVVGESRAWRIRDGQFVEQVITIEGATFAEDVAFEEVR